MGNSCRGYSLKFVLNGRIPFLAEAEKEKGGKTKSGSVDLAIVVRSHAKTGARHDMWGFGS